MSRWFRFYDEALDDPKVQSLPPDLFKAWVNLLCLASRNGGRLPDEAACAFALRIDENALRTVLERLSNATLIDRRNGGKHGSHNAPHGWEKRQYKSDTSTERVKRFRNVSKAVAETPPEAETEAETEAEKKQEEDRPADAGNVVDLYAFEAGVIRLTQADLDRWVRAFPYISVEAELWSLSEWAEKQPKWFTPVASALAKKNRDAIDRLNAAKAENEEPSGYWDSQFGWRKR